MKPHHYHIIHASRSFVRQNTLQPEALRRVTSINPFRICLRTLLLRRKCPAFHLPGLTPPISRIAIRRQQKRDVVRLPLLDPEDDRDLGEERVLLAVVTRRVEAQRPPRRALYAAQHVLEGVDGHLAGRGGGAVGQPGLDAAVVVGLRLEDAWGSREGRGAVMDGRGGGRGLEAEAHVDAARGAAEGGVEDVAGYAVFCLGHFYVVD